MENAQRCRAIALLCRQQAGRHPEESWKWLGQAERWEHLADCEHLADTEFTEKVKTRKVEPDSAAA